jgi:hypothetical protein
LASFHMTSQVTLLSQSLRQGLGGDNGELATSRLRADSGQETDSVYIAMI